MHKCLPFLVESEAKKLWSFSNGTFSKLIVLILQNIIKNAAFSKHFNIFSVILA